MATEVGGAQPLVVARDLTLEYSGHGGRAFQAVRGLDFEVRPGELFGVVGENGAGKSTLARAVAGRSGRRSQTAWVRGGSLTVLGRSVRDLGERSRRVLTESVGYLPQQAGELLDADRTVAENVSEPIFERDRHYDQRRAGRRAAELVDAVQLPLALMARYPWELSPGQRQRVAIARSLVLGPTLWVADEPTAGVDVTVRDPVLDTLFALAGGAGFTAMIVSHDAAVMKRLTDRVAVLHRGVLVGIGRVDTVLANPAHPYVAGLADDYRTRTTPIPVQTPRP